MKKKNLKLLKNIILGIMLIAIIIILCLIITRKTQLPQTMNEQAKPEYTTQIGTQTYDITNAVTETPNIPNISAGMIPIKYENNNWVITTKDDASWYNYGNGQPAYMMLNDGTYQSELIADMTGKKLALDVVRNDAHVVPPDKLGSIYIWIPRFAYNDTGEILYIKQSCSVSRNMGNTKHIYICNRKERF